jgi:hypothetical protein
VTQVAEPLPPSARPQAPRRRDERTGRLPVVVAMILSLFACAITQNWSIAWKEVRSPVLQLQGEGTRTALGSMNSYALALMLGGLRGPLVMVLWSKVENQKIDRELEDVDTMIEWIRLLQPEFDTVHIFQIWNKAYNISVLMASASSKYTTILDAIDYARRVDADRPNDLNILDSIAQVYAEKLGGKNTQERGFYRRQFREDTLTDQNAKKAFPDDAAHRRLGLKYFGRQDGPLLDGNNNLLPALLAAQTPRPSDLAADSEWNDGSELQYLRPYQPFPYGISPSAMGYNYAKRAQVAMTVGGQHPLQLSDMVIDTRPALVLKQWAEEEADRGVTQEAKAFGIPSDADPHALAVATAGISPAQKPADPHALDAAINAYEISAQVCPAALREYDRHLSHPQYINELQRYESHKDDVNALQRMSAADRDYLRIVTASDTSRLVTTTGEEYAKARAVYQRIVLKYYVEEGIAPQVFPPGISPANLDGLPDDQVDPIYRKMAAVVNALDPGLRMYDESRSEYEAYIRRADTRLATLGYGQKSILQQR